MTDTARTSDYFVNETTGALRDGTDEGITAQVLRDLVVSVWGGYGGLVGPGKNTSATTITDSYTKMVDLWGTITDYPVADDVTLNLSDHDMTIGTTGVYAVMARLDLTDVAAESVTFAVGVDGAAGAGAEVALNLATCTSDSRSVALFAVLSITAGQKLSLLHKATGATKTLKSWYPSLVVVRLA